MTQPDDDASLGDMQKAFREKGYRQNADGSFETNEGRVWLESPHETTRRRIYDRSRTTRSGYFFKGKLNPATQAQAEKLAKDPELDIDWGIYTPEDMPMKSMHGFCEGGPYAGKPIVHGETPMLVAIEIEPGTGRELGVLPAHIDASVPNPYVIFKAYEWQADKRIWRWDDTVRRRSETQK